MLFVHYRSPESILYLHSASFYDSLISVKENTLTFTAGAYALGFMVYLVMLSVFQSIWRRMLEWRVNNELERMWKEVLIA
jgi:hypothetical protein